MDDNNGVTDDPRDTEIFIAGMSYWTSHADLDTFNSDTLVSYIFWVIFIKIDKSVITKNTYTLC